MSEDRIKKARELLNARWPEAGECRSCGWHAALYEHDVTDDEIREALDDDGVLQLICMSDDEESFRHRGVKISVRDEDQQEKQK